MPIITVKVIKGVVLTSDEQKRELLAKMTDAFIGVVGDVARPYTYCIIEETPLYEWSIGGRPLPDLPFLYGPEYAEMHSKANALMRAYIESQTGDGGGGGNGASAASDPLASQTPAMGDESAQAQWAGTS
jgi:4-oxalocrotonate tautomerase